jgi:DNA repair protein RecN (Recombination protein N)
MLEELRLRGLGVIDDALLELGPGFTAITGETGAGKTMVLTGLGLLLGARADPGLLRRGAPRLEVEGRLRVAETSPVVSRVADAGGTLDAGSLIIARTMGPDGRSRAHVGGRSVPVGLLGEIADELVTVHGQADQRGLLRPATQRAVLDHYGGRPVSAALARYRDLFARVSTLQGQLLEVTSRRRERMQEADLLRLGLAEIDQADPRSGEEETLRAEIERLAHADALRLASTQARTLLAGADPAEGGGALDAVGGARRALEEVQGRDPALDTLAGRLAEVAYLLADTSADLGAYANAVEADPARLEAAQQRLAVLRQLTRKYAADIDGVLEWAGEARQRLGSLDGDDERVEQLTAEHAALLATLAEAASALSGARQTAARRLATAATTELGALAMSGARLSVEVRQRPDPGGLLVHGLAGGPARVAFGASGIDDVEILLTARRDAEPRPLQRGASGGELSRVMLALEVVLAGSDPVPTFVFDEVDAGVGGQAAVEVGRRLAMLAGNAQVIVVTHLPQVAAFADRHIVVRKSDRGAGATSVETVAGAARVEELSRMLAGLPDSELGRSHAEELLAVATAAKGAA